MIRRKSLEDLVYNIPYKKLGTQLSGQIDRKVWALTPPGLAYDVWENFIDSIDGFNDDRLSLITRRVEGRTEIAIDSLRVCDTE